VIRRSALGVALIAAGMATSTCNGSTGDLLVTFPAYAAGATGASQPFTVYGATPNSDGVIPSDEVFTVQLTYAHMYVGAIYVDAAPASSGGTFNTPACISMGIYCAQVPAGLDVDLLNPSPQPFPVQGNGSADLGLSWQLYVTQGDVNNPNPPGFGVPDTADLIGTATRKSDSAVFTWGATVTISGQNRGQDSNQLGQPGLDPICQRRILNLADISLTLAPGVSMLLTIDPRGWFLLPLDFSQLPPVNSQQCTQDQSSIYENPDGGGPTADVCIPDSSNLSGAVLGAQQGATLFTGIFTAGSAAYSLTYTTMNL
jgi:hypothetical protein